MKKKYILLVASLLILVSIISYIVLSIMNRPEVVVDENLLYTKQFGDTVLKFERYDYVLGQKMLVGVEKSTDGGKTYDRVTEELITVSTDARFLFLDESLGFAISTLNVERSNNFLGLKVTQDGGKTFSNALLNYTNDKVDLITIESFPYYDGSDLKLNCSIHELNETGDGYQTTAVIFISSDKGLTWNLLEE